MISERRQEGQDLEFKRVARNFNDIGQTACAFANTSGGEILIGVDDRGDIIGLEESRLDDIQLRLSGAVQCVSPTPLHNIQIEKEGGKSIIRLSIRTLAPDAFCTHNGLIYVRSGSSNLRLDGPALMQFLADRQLLRYDFRTSEETLEDIDEKKVREYLQKRSPGAIPDPFDLRDVLFNLKLATSRGDLRNAAVLMFSNNPRRAVPQSEIRLVRFAGREPVRILDKLYADGTVLENLSTAEAFIFRNIKVGLKIEGMVSQEVPEYPVAAIRELLINAVVHRDYFDCNGVQVSIFDDRIEIVNPGRLLPGLSISALGSISIQRNPLLYGLLRELRIVEGMASGIPRIRSAMMEAGLPDPRFEEIAGFFKVTLLNSSARELSPITDRQKRMLRVIQEKGKITTGEVSFMMSVSVPTAYNDLQALEKAGYVLRKGKGRGSYYLMIK
ncbi:MAG: DeoR family transcriptional regulator [Euryarchaeota archaeon]|nr:DeoR family transcriptional regulator [Euryarchaeota archaeon]